MRYSKKVERQIINCLVAVQMMKDIPDTLIIKNLADWKDDYQLYDAKTHMCGSPACFGGWVAQHPHYQKQGVYASRAGAPTDREGYALASAISWKLFGEFTMFDANFDGSLEDRAEVMRRIQEALNTLLESA